MRVPISWLREYAPIPAPVDAPNAGLRLTAAGLEVEAVEQVGHDVHGVIVAQVLTIEELTGFKKPIRYCRVAISDAELTADPATVTGVICGAANFKGGRPGRLRRPPGATLPGGFEITASQEVRPGLPGHDLRGRRARHRRGPQRHPDPGAPTPRSASTSPSTRSCPMTCSTSP